MSQTTLLLKGEGTNNSTNIVDSSLFLIQITIVGSNTTISTTQFPYGSSSIYFGNPLTSYLSINTYSFFTNDFTLETYCFISSYSTGVVLWDNRNSSYQDGFSFFINSSGKLVIYNLNNSNGEIVGNTILTVNTWYHIALTRENGIFYIFLNGILDFSVNTALNFNISSTASFRIGQIVNNILFSYNQFYIKDYRILSGKALYTTNFTPPIDLQLQPNEVLSYFLNSPSFYLLPTKPPVNWQDSLYLLEKTVSGLDCEFQARNLNELYYRVPLITIDGTITIDYIPASRQVYLFEWLSKKLVRVTWSDSITGYYKFDDIREGSYFVWTEDYENVYRPQSTMEIAEPFTYDLNFSSVSGSYNQYIEDPFDIILTLFSGVAKYNNDDPVSKVTLLSEVGEFITSVIPDNITGAYSFYVKKGNKYIIVFVGNGIYRPESYFYQAPN